MNAPTGRDMALEGIIKYVTFGEGQCFCEVMKLPWALPWACTLYFPAAGFCKHFPKGHTVLGLVLVTPFLLSCLLLC